MKSTVSEAAGGSVWSLTEGTWGGLGESSLVKGLIVQIDHITFCLQT